MEAGDTLSFIRPFNGERNMEGKEKADELRSTFEAICEGLSRNYPEVPRSMELPKINGNIRISETSHRIDSADGSYLHVLNFCRAVDGIVIDRGISINEHSQQGIFLGGYTYILTEGRLVRDTNHVGTMNDERSDSGHYSLVALYEELFALKEAEQSDIKQEREYAEREMAEVQQDIAIADFEKDLGTDVRPPEVTELYKLRVLLRDAYPFTPTDL